MRRLELLAIVTILLAAIGAANPVLLPASGSSAHTPAIAEPPQVPCRSTVTLLTESTDGVTLRFETTPSVAAPPLERTSPTVVRYTGPAGSPGRGVSWSATASAPARLSLFVRVPDTGAIAAVVEDVELEAVGEGEPRWRVDPEAVDAADLVRISEPAILRGVRVVRVLVSPFAASDRGGTLVASLTLRITAEQRPGLNERGRRGAVPSAAFERILRSAVINVASGGPAAAREPRNAREGAAYLFIVPDDFENAVRPLVEWKEKKGITCRVALLSETGSTTQSIRAFISDAYFEWDAPPEYVLLVGDSERIPIHDGLTLTDNFYAAIDGTDYLADVLIGRLPAETAAQCAYLVAKALAYERADVAVEPHWPASAALFVREDGDHSDAVYYANTEFVLALADSAGFAPIDTLYADGSGTGATQAEVMAVMNAGRGFVNFRGSAYAIWPMPFAFYPPTLTNGWNQPVVMSATCATVGYDADHYLSHSLTRAGSVDDPKGCVAFFGTTTAGFGLDWKRGYVDEGFFAHAFGEGLTLGEACAAGKLQLFFMAEDRQEYEGWTLMGDPELNLWTAPRGVLEVTHDDLIQAGPLDFVVHVTSGGDPVAGARVTCTKDPDVAASGLTDASGRAVLAVVPTSAGTLAVVVTARNAAPHTGQVDVVDTGPFIVLSSMSIDDSVGGNGDGLASPGEWVALELSLSNTGDQPAEAVTAIVRTSDELVTIIDSVAVYGSLPPGSVAPGDRAYRVAVDEERRRDLPLDLAVLIEYDEWTRLSHLPPIDIAAGSFVIATSEFDDRAPGGNGNGTADPGESGALSIELLNEGECGLSSVAATLTSSSPWIAVLSGHAALADAPPGSIAVNLETPFVVSVSPSAPTNEVAWLSLLLTGVGHSYSYADTLSVPVTVEDAPATLPTGPDAYGYYAYDSGDTRHLEHPTYEWVDIAPPGPGEHIRYVSAGDDRMKLEILPFPFSYYGDAEYYISIGSNGVVAFGSSDYFFGDNSGIPDLHGPAAMVAPFWDDLNPAQGGDVYHWHDTEEHRYVIQYEDVLRADTDAPETFQITLLDPAYHPTPTGDGVIIFQYEDVSETNGCTVGIENRYQDDGIQYAFDGAYDPHAAPLDGGLAILFTTAPPSSPDAPWIVIRNEALDDSTDGNGNGIAESGENLTLVVELENIGSTGASDLELTLSSEDSMITIIDGVAAIGDVPAGAAGSNADHPFAIAVADAAAEKVVTLWIAVGGNAGETQSAFRLDVPVHESHDIITAVALSPCYPNPSRASTTMRLDLPGAGRATFRVSVRVYDVAGRRVATPFEGPLPPGSHDISWDGRGSDGARAASGVYFVRVDAGGVTETRKAVLLRW